VAQFGSISYAFPGTILALGVLWPMSSIDNAIDLLMREWFGISSGLLFSGTAFALVAAYVIRFLAVAFGSVDSGFQAIPKVMDKLPRLLGKKTSLYSSFYSSPFTEIKFNDSKPDCVC